MNNLILERPTINPTDFGTDFPTDLGFWKTDCFVKIYKQNFFKLNPFFSTKSMILVTPNP